MPEQRRKERVRVVSEEAAYWFLRVSDEKLNYSDRREFLRWLRRSPENIAELFRIIGLDGGLGRAKLVAKLEPDEISNVVELAVAQHHSQHHSQYLSEHLADDDLPEEREAPKMSWSRRITAVAASVVMVCVLGFMTKSIWFDRAVATEIGQWREQPLTDGSVVHMGPLTRLQVSFGDKRRTVHLSDGEAVFDVAKDSHRPFKVMTDLIDVEAVGTKFGVSIDKGVTVTVSEGVVKVSLHGRDNDENAVRLVAGQELRVPEGGGLTAKVLDVDAKRKLEWTDGWIAFDGETIGEAARQFNRRNIVQIRIDQPSLAAKRIDFRRFRVDSPEDFAKSIAASPDIALIPDQSGRVLRLELE